MRTCGSGFLQRQLRVVVVACLAMFAERAHAVIVRFESVLGTFDVRLYEEATPLTTANFLNYATRGDWTDTFIHRSVPNFVIQGGGHKFPSDAVGIQSVPQDSPVTNEPGISNLRGTIAMAKLAGNPHSATNQWYFNTGDNAFLDSPANGSFTVFGRVVGSGMEVIDAIGALPRINAGIPFGELPVRDAVSGAPKKEDLVTFNSIAPRNLPAGDYNFDGVADLADLAVWQADLSSTVKAEADGNGDGVVDRADFAVWQQSSGMVPEPAAACLASWGLGLLMLRRRVLNASAT